MTASKAQVNQLPTMETNASPVVSIGIPTYNGGARILNSLTSIWAQQYPNLEIIISDNCSTDNTQETIQEICKGHPEIKYFRQQANIGMMPNFLFLKAQATGKYFMWVSDDDRLEPGVLWKYVAFLEANADHSLVSGQIKYWHDGKPDLTEGGFTFQSDIPMRRVVSFYGKVIYGGLIHGLMRREFVQQIPLHKVIGNDYHFIANVAYLGKIRNFDFIGYNKSFGGLSSNFRRYARSIGDSNFAGWFPQTKMAMDAYAEIMYRSPVFSGAGGATRLMGALGSFFGRLYCYCGRILIWSRILKYIVTPVRKLFK